jgi:uncharacterized paraquat-inducible protein A
MQTMKDYLPPFTSEKRCPRCHERLHWSEHEHPPTVHFNTRTGYVSGVSLMLYCICCGYKLAGYVSVQRDPVWKEEQEEEEVKRS